MQILAYQKRIVVVPRSDTYVELVPDGAFAFQLFLLTAESFPVPVSLADYSMAKVAFTNCKGIRTVVEAVTPLAAPDSGILSFVGTSLQATNMDQLWRSADLELTKGANVEVYPLTDYFKILQRNSPPSA